MRLDESYDFEPRWQPGRASLDPDQVTLEESDGLLRVQLTPVAYGMPRRHRRPPALRLAEGEWVRWQINYRFGTAVSGAWYYRLDTLNLGHGPLKPDVFLGTPTHRVDERASLR